ncbi:hypothetical protein GCM10008955_09070 [Deinococcus malanensis]|uniref:ATP-grasp domain-containing protein n=1 Tax=Deinococcus malanensis TaxID=1706855 RepID=A0ABQ2EQS5_9DEIO|nr:hypothetical protein [Deinococcus malanensis]GGK17765.1 hypothetical protein GCM10008955_09070 [Deinococcus malanensis]
MRNLLVLTDLHYQTNSRNYSAEDLYLTEELQKSFHVALCHPRHSEAFEDSADVILFRNAGPVAAYAREYELFTARMSARNCAVFNSLDGKGDMKGKQYLVDLTRQHYPVIPTVNGLAELDLLPDSDRYLTKPMNGADSHGIRVAAKQELLTFGNLPSGTLIQPWVDFEYEVSFYYLNDVFQYALYTADKRRRWALELYRPSPDDLAFSRLFIEWNAMKHGIQRVDACRTPDGRLLLVEHEDLNPFLSLDLLDDETRRNFVGTLVEALRALIPE